jgi:hypothetical protein
MRVPTVLAALALAPAAASAEGWELRAGLERVSASVCTEAGDCFGVQCTASGGWRALWMAELTPTSGTAVPDPIFAIRVGGERFALTSLAASTGPDGEPQYIGAIRPGEDSLITALMGAEVMSVDPGRDFNLAEFTLRGSRWALEEAMTLCEAGGPEIFAPEEEVSDSG